MSEDETDALCGETSAYLDNSLTVDCNPEVTSARTDEELTDVSK